MLELLFFYMFVWWFKKLEDKKTITIRAVVAGIIGVFMWIVAFASISMVMFEAALVVVVIVGFCVAILFTIRFICDISQIIKLNDTEKPKTTSENTDTKPSDCSKNKRQAEQEAKKSEQDRQQYLVLIEKCGIRFFIKYYRQILRLPLKDVDVTENYSSAECEERLLAAKKIIDLGLSELALTEIIRAYNDILDKEIIEQAKALLDEIRKAN